MVTVLGPSVKRPQISSEKKALLAHVVAHRGFSSPFSNFPPPTLPDSSKPLQQFIHVMTASGIGLFRNECAQLHPVLGFS